MDILQKFRSSFVIFDGGFGTELQKRGMGPGDTPEAWNISHKDDVTAIHKSYLDAGANIVSANTFGANPLKCGFYRESIRCAIECAKAAVEQKKAECPDLCAYVALDVGPTGRLLKPAGDLDFEAAVAAYAESIKVGAEAGADLILIETINDIYELKAAVLAAKENCDLPVLASVVFDETGHMLTGADPAAVCALLEGLGVDAIGTNCSLGPKQLKKIVPQLVENAGIPVFVNPNAGLPKFVDGKTVFMVGPDEFALELKDIALSGARGLGGCCGTTPAHIEALVKAVADLQPKPIIRNSRTVVSSGTHAVEIGISPILIGERINPTGKKAFKQALRDCNIDYILGEGFAQAEKVVQILDVNVGLPEIDENDMMTRAVTALQASLDLPLQIDTSSPAVLESAMRIYNGKPLVNSVNGKRESLDAVLPLVKKYGGVVVALTLDETGIPATAQGRFKIAEHIVREAESYGISRNDIIVDALTMAVSAEPDSAKVTLDTIKLVKEHLGVKTCLGVSNVSFGLPNRPLINSVFFSLALGAGLDAAIMNPYSQEMMTAYYSFMALNGLDEGFGNYIDFAQNVVTVAQASAPSKSAEATSSTDALQDSIIKGMSERAAKETEKLLSEKDPLEIIDGHIIPALDAVGKDFEVNKVFLPQLLVSASAAQTAFEEIKKRIPASGAQKGRIVLATVHGDIHDIGKNIVKVLLENYGFDVIDLGRDVPAETVVGAVKESGAKLVGLSALMTTTVPAMEETIKLIHAECPGVAVTVGGAVLTEEYAQMIGADKYTKDAMGAVRFAEEYFS